MKSFELNHFIICFDTFENGFLFSKKHDSNIFLFIAQISIENKCTVGRANICILDRVKHFKKVVLNLNTIFQMNFDHIIQQIARGNGTNH